MTTHHLKTRHWFTGGALYAVAALLAALLLGQMHAYLLAALVFLVLGTVALFHLAAGVDVLVGRRIGVLDRFDAWQHHAQLQVTEARRRIAEAKPWK